MIQWIQQPEGRRRQILNQTSTKTGIRPHAIEKDWWVTLVLRAIFSTKWKEQLVFKGGTSLSKSWQLIERFSEDIDLAIDKEFLGFKGDPNKSKIERLRRALSEFICQDFRVGFTNVMLEMGLPENVFTISAIFEEDSIRDPQVLELGYVSVLDPVPNPYLREKVIIEVGARSLKDPFSARSVNTIISHTYPRALFSDAPFDVPTVDPKRTFLEKAFLMHELFQKGDNRAHDRMSRHLYDLECLMHTEHAKEALNDQELYESIVSHRKAFNKITGIDYEAHGRDKISFLPPEENLNQWEKDYRAMQENMIWGKSLPFERLMTNLKELQALFREH